MTKYFYELGAYILPAENEQNMKYGNAVIILFYLTVLPIFLRLHFLIDVCLV